MTAPRQHPRRRLAGRRTPPAIYHAPDPALNVATDLADLDTPPADVSRETSAAGPMAPYVAGGQVPPPLSRERIALLEALTAQWARDVRVGGPGPDDTMLAPPSQSRPAVPPSRRTPPAPTVQLPPAIRQRLEDADLLAETPQESVVRQFVAAVESSGPPARVSDWASRHDPRSLEFAVRARLSRPVPLQDFLLERGPVLDQGTTPPLSAHDASACVGMAVVAAAGALGHRGLTVADARHIYGRAQQLDTVTGEAYAGTSVLAGMKAGQEAGWWDTYLWALGGTRDVAQALLQLRAPVVIGVPWTTGLEEPDGLGIIRPTGGQAGGHALAVVGLRVNLRGADGHVLPGPFFVLQQSRGPAEGAGGLVALHHTHLARMLAGTGEAAVPLPRTLP